MRFKAIIFDMDGTIVDSDHIWQKVTDNLVLSKKADATLEQLALIQEKTKGLALHGSCTIIKDVLGLEHELEHLMAEKAKMAQELYKEKVHFIEGFREFHNDVLDANLKVSIATNAGDDTLHATNSKLNLEKYFGKHMYNITHVNNVYKPAPDLYLYAAKQLGVAPEECIAIEDSAHGIRAAVAAGMFCIGINTGKNREALKEAHLIIDHYDEIELVKLLKKL